MVGKVEDFLARLPKKEELTQHDRNIIGGNSVRIDIPLTSTSDLRKIPELLRGYATYIEFKIQQQGLEERSKLIEIGAEGRTLRSRIRDIAGQSKFNKNGTVKRG